MAKMKVPKGETCGAKLKKTTAKIGVCANTGQMRYYGAEDRIKRDLIAYEPILYEATLYKDIKTIEKTREKVNKLKKDLQKVNKQKEDEHKRLKSIAETRKENIKKKVDRFEDLILGMARSLDKKLSQPTVLTDKDIKEAIGETKDKKKQERILKEAKAYQK